ncbi:MAG: hypothetical protein US57_C0013G0011 [Candidatus Moranbacteria bacterium GW2011_GWC2_37_73]|nr:MAG: hypothetical protein UR95_C0003G0083 [Parcubacteria group bacterium GW2011_GWC1_36_108]KKP99945.1 MAG: hypothetical protein US09_C0027G0009 [Candidatus Moranbacteria bacterium GW2011_GWD1_36_198]KKQ00114.1 MAG: hypothetical protein US10_C0041G0003 [Candidatus Moranbacteria bacterium GW2011_GWD2_36_198]KKQ39431.1 MAG: hypothetical protein US57_C0013G0011 [Candidatus Moranbacteria bacterium GW2011_GWC2_37_73]HAS00166.1 hypothetical protein [Candidatus Moranbacteria bacterium]
MKKYSLKFWVIFWSVSGLFLLGWFFYWNTQNRGVASSVENVLSFLPINDSQKKEYQALTKVGDFLLKSDDKEKKLLVLFQNNMEIRPGGGFIGAFGIVKLKNGKIISLETHDLSNFDAKIPNIITPPYPLEETGVADFWKLRDSNFSPDFAINAKKAEEFYQLGGGEEDFDGVIGITANVLSSILKITGPISIEGYPGTYNSDNAILSLEYQVEKAFEEQGIDRGERKLVMADFAKEIENRVFAFSVSQKIELGKILLEDLNKKDIQLNFKDKKLQNEVENANWAGVMDQNWDKDYLMIVDANVGAFKSDYYVKRSIDHTVDLSKEIPVAYLKITYNHTATQKDWMTRDYRDYLRVYIPENSQLIDQKNFDDTRFGAEFGKKYFGAIVRVPIGTSKTVEINYNLPQELKNDYNLKIQKQAGLNDVPIVFHLIREDGTTEEFSKVMNSDLVLSDLK